MKLESSTDIFITRSFFCNGEKKNQEQFNKCFIKNEIVIPRLKLKQKHILESNFKSQIF